MSKAQTDVVFLIALGIGLAMIVGLYIWNSGIHIYSPSKPAHFYQPRSKGMESGVVESYPIAGLVGQAEERAGATKKFPVFNATHLDEDVSFGNFSGRVFNGILYGKKDAVIISELENRSATIKFRISSTNGYGSLVVIANKCTIANRKFAVGAYSLEIPADCVSNSTRIVLHASSSSWRIWAPTVYDISSLSVHQRRLVYRPASLEFSIPENVYKSLDKVYLTLMLPFHDGEVGLEVNGMSAGWRKSEDEMIYHLPASYFRKGDNKITIRVSNGGYLRGTAELELFYYLSTDKAVQKIVEITPQKMDELRDGGEIKFFVSKVYKPGGLALTITNSRNYMSMRAYLPVHYGEYDIPIGPGNMTLGENKITIKSVDGSAFEVDRVEVVW